MVAHHRLCTSPIIGIDLLSSSNLLVDLMARRLVDLTTNYHTSGTLTNAPMKSVSTLSDDRYFRGLLMRFVSVITVSLKHSMACVTHSVKHHIETNGKPIADRPRLKKYISYLAKAFVVHRKAAGLVRFIWYLSGAVVGERAETNVSSIPVPYPVAHGQDFVEKLHGKSIFTTLDLVRTYYQIPMAQDYVHVAL